MSRALQLATFSIAAFDPASESWGVAVQSAFLAAGSIVPWAKAATGAVATQALANPRFGPLGLALLEQGMIASDVVASLAAGDSGRALRQVGVVDRRGRAAAYTGEDCPPWAGHRVGEHYSCQGNILASEAVLSNLAESYERAAERPFAERLVAALQAAQAAGGDSRGQQSAALVVVRRDGGFAGLSDRVIDLRIDDHPAPIDELARLLALHRQLYGPP